MSSNYAFYTPRPILPVEFVALFECCFSDRLLGNASRNVPQYGANDERGTELMNVTAGTNMYVESNSKSLKYVSR